MVPEQHCVHGPGRVAYARGVEVVEPRQLVHLGVTLVQLVYHLTARGCTDVYRTGVGARVNRGAALYGVMEAGVFVCVNV